MAGHETLGKPDAEEEKLRASLTAQQLRLEASVQRQDADEATTLEVRRAIEETRARLDARRTHREAVATSDTHLPESLRGFRRNCRPARRCSPTSLVTRAHMPGC